MQSQFKVGDKVRIIEGTRYYGESDFNPAGEVGTIVDISYSSIYVMWEAGKNIYSQSDLELVSKNLVTVKLKGGKVVCKDGLSKEDVRIIEEAVCTQ